MTQLDDGTVVTDIDAHDQNAMLATQGYTIRCVENWYGDAGGTFVLWDVPAITEQDLPF